MVDGISNNSSNPEIYKKQNTDSTSSSSGVGNTPEWMLKAQSEMAAWEASLPVSSDEGEVTYDTTVEDLQNQLLELQNNEPSGFQKGIQIASTIATGVTQIISALNPGGDSASSGPTDLKSAMRACQADKPSQTDVTALDKYITKAENKLNKKLSDQGKYGQMLKSMEPVLAADIVQKEKDITNITTALGQIEKGQGEVEVEINGTQQKITANAEAAGTKKTVIEQYAGAQQEGESQLHQLGRALTNANNAKDLKQGEIDALKAPVASAYTKEVEEDDGNGGKVKKTVPDTDAYNRAKANYEQTKAQKERELQQIKNEIADIESCIQVGNQTLAQIEADKAHAEEGLDMILGTTEGLKDNQDALTARKNELLGQARQASTSRTAAQTARDQSVQNQTQAEKELQKSRQTLDELISQKHQIDEAKAIRDAAQAKISGGTTATPRQ